MQKGNSESIDREVISALGLDSDRMELVKPIEHGGSERTFYRVAFRNTSYIVMLHRGIEEEFERYVELDRFLARHGIGVPEIHAVDKAHKAILMEDLGETHLEDILNECSETEAARQYRKAIELLIELQTSVTKGMYAERTLEGREFTKSRLLAETEYFVEEFVNDYCRIEEFDIDMDRIILAEEISKEPLVFMHRDFQSKNIMLYGGELRLVDFQSAHRGPGLYDAASLLKDPYHPIGEALREELLEALFEAISGTDATKHDDFGSFKKSFTYCGIQRNMQALAAFARLGVKMGKKQFLKSIPPALGLLEEGLNQIDGLSSLKELLGRIKMALEREV